MAQDFKKRQQEWRDQGWHITDTGGGHLKMTHPRANRFIITAKSPSDVRAIKNIESQLKRALTDFSGTVAVAPSNNRQY
jgi:predicted RNA binding protein YcfA (HicA-like mRNA interferase family)